MDRAWRSQPVDEIHLLATGNGKEETTIHDQIFVQSRHQQCITVTGRPNLYNGRQTVAPSFASNDASRYFGPDCPDVSENQKAARQYRPAAWTVAVVRDRDKGLASDYASPQKPDIRKDWRQRAIHGSKGNYTFRRDCRSCLRGGVWFGSASWETLSHP